MPLLGHSVGSRLSAGNSPEAAGNGAKRLERESPHGERIKAISGNPVQYGTALKALR